MIGKDVWWGRIAVGTVVGHCKRAVGARCCGYIASSYNKCPIGVLDRSGTPMGRRNRDGVQTTAADHYVALAVA